MAAQIACGEPNERKSNATNIKGAARGSKKINPRKYDAEVRNNLTYNKARISTTPDEYLDLR